MLKAVIWYRVLLYLLIYPIGSKTELKENIRFTFVTWPQTYLIVNTNVAVSLPDV